MREAPLRGRSEGAGQQGGAGVLIGAGQADTGSTEPSSVFLGAYYNIGGGLKLWGETTTVDFDDGGDDLTKTLLGMRIDF